MSEKAKVIPYGSAQDLPSFLELQEELMWLKPLSWLKGRQGRAQVLQIERDLKEWANTVDDFYRRLGERNWIFHESLNLTTIKAINATDTIDDSERQFVEMYRQPGVLETSINHLAALPAMQPRRLLINRSLNDNRKDRFYAVVLVLLTVMDGFVNEIDTQRRGLHARSSEELVAWDSVVGHHMGLSHAHETFSLGVKKTTTEEAYDLQRNGILHGTVLNYDNIVIATKAWNRLFAVADWARSLERMNQPIKPKPTWRELLVKLQDRALDEQARKNWKPSTATAGETGFEELSVWVAANSFLSAWQKRNYGGMVKWLPDTMLSQNIGARPAHIRDIYQREYLESFTIERIVFPAIAVAELDAVIQVNGTSASVRMRWIRERPETGYPAYRDEDGDWKAYVSLFEAMKKRRQQSDGQGS